MLNPPDFKGCWDRTLLFPALEEGAAALCAINSMGLGLNRANSGIYPEDRTAQLWDEQHVRLHCSGMDGKTLSQTRGGGLDTYLHSQSLIPLSKCLKQDKDRLKHTVTIKIC